MLVKIKNPDWSILVLLIILLMIGVVAIFSASTTKIGDEYHTENYYYKQIVWIIIAFGLTLFMLRIPYTVIDFLIIPSFILSVILLIVVLFLPEIKGSHRWIQLGFFNLQPSELAKITTIMLIAKLISKPGIGDGKILVRSFGIVIIPILLIMLEPDLGTTLIFIMILFSLLLASDLPLFYIILMLAPLLSVITSFFSVTFFIVYMIILILILYRTRLSWIIIGLNTVFNTFVFFITPLIWNGLKVYQRNRILSFIEPSRDPFGAGYQIIQSKIAIGSGKLFGKGFLLGTQKNLNFLPEHHTDFIFSVIGEEFGFIGCFVVLALFFLLLLRISIVINKLKRKEMRYISVGIFAYLTFQVFVNVGMNLGIVPTTGVPLPFISYGGSNLLINILGISLILKFLNEKSIF